MGLSMTLLNTHQPSDARHADLLSRDDELLLARTLAESRHLFRLERELEKQVGRRDISYGYGEGICLTQNVAAWEIVMVLLSRIANASAVAASLSRYLDISARLTLREVKTVPELRTEIDGAFDSSMIAQVARDLGTGEEVACRLIDEFALDTGVLPLMIVDLVDSVLAELHPDVDTVGCPLPMLKRILQDTDLSDMLERQESSIAVCFHQYRHAGEHARSRLVEAHDGLAAFHARRYAGNGVDLDDLMQEGRIGLVGAVDRWMYRRGARFSSYATWWIRGAILGSLAETHTIKVSSYHANLIRKMNQHHAMLLQDKGRDPTTDELAASMSLPEAKVRNLQMMSLSVYSLDMPIGEDEEDGFCLGDTVVDQETLGPAEALDVNDFREQVLGLLDLLTASERKCLVLRFGLDGSNTHSLNEVAVAMGMDITTIRQIQSVALYKMRFNPNARRLAETLV